MRVVHLAARVEVLPYSHDVVASTPSTVYFYVGLDCASKAGCSQVVSENGGLNVVDPTTTSKGTLRVEGATGQLGKFVLETAVSSTDTLVVRDTREDERRISVAFVGKPNLPLVDVKRRLEGMYAEHRRSARRPKQQKPDTSVLGPFVLPNTVDDGSNVMLVQITGNAPFSVDFVFRDAAAKNDAGDDNDSHEDMEQIPGQTVTGWLEIGSKIFSDRFGKTFALETKGFQPGEIRAAKAALSNLLGGMGYFTGSSEVRGAGVNGRNGRSFEAKLFSAVPSRSFFPRGFLWDEGFHQLLVNAWHRPTSIDVLGHWLSVLHVHDQAEDVGDDGRGVSGGWLPREQILGEEARRRVPSEFIAQVIHSIIILSEARYSDATTPK